MNRVASNTRNRLRADHSMILASISMSPVLRLQLGDDPYARFTFYDLEIDVLSQA